MAQRVGQELAGKFQKAMASAAHQLPEDSFDENKQTDNTKRLSVSQRNSASKKDEMTFNSEKSPSELENQMANNDASRLDVELLNRQQDRDSMVQVTPAKSTVTDDKSESNKPA